MPPHGSSSETKAQAIFWAFAPESLPDFPLPDDLLDEIAELPGALPTSLDEWVAIMQAEQAERAVSAAPPDDPSTIVLGRS